MNFPLGLLLPHACKGDFLDISYCKGPEFFSFQIFFSLSAPSLDKLVFIFKCSDTIWNWPNPTSQLWLMRQFSLALDHLFPKVMKFLVLLSCLNEFLMQAILYVKLQPLHCCSAKLLIPPSIFKQCLPQSLIFSKT